MSSETDHPRQRTVAELLAQHGADPGSATGRRRRRREPDDAVDEPGATGSVEDGDAGGGAPPAAWPPARSPMPERSAAQPPASLAGPARDAGRTDPPRPPSAIAPQQYAPPVSGASPAVRSGPANQWGPPARREPDRPPTPSAGSRAVGFPGEQVDPRRDRMPTGGWGAQPRPGQPWDHRPADAPPESASATGQWNSAPAGPPPRAFPPGPEPARGAPPHAQSPHAGSAGAPAAAQFGGPPTQLSGRPVFDQPTGVNPAQYGRPGPGGQADPGLTGPIDQQRMQAMGQGEATSRVQDPRRAVDPDHGPATAVGLPPAGAEDWHRARVGPDRPQPGDAGPATAVGVAPVGAEDWHRSRVGPARVPPGRPRPDDGGPATEAAGPMDFDDFDGHPAGLGPVSGAIPRVGAPDDAGPAGVAPDEDAAAEEGSGQSWAPVLAQWIIGAIGGAALWVGFRYLWSSLLVVAIAAAILVTAGLVVVVRTVLHNSDLRTSVAAGAVGILLTVSPAVLVLLGR
jgi:hypothetical protein